MKRLSPVFSCRLYIFARLYLGIRSLISVIIVLEAPRPLYACEACEAPFRPVKPVTWIYGAVIYGNASLIGRLC